MQKTFIELEAELDTMLLDDIAANLPEYEPYPSGGSSVTVKDMYPNLTTEQLDYVMSKYTGSMERG